jgi:hypothetical protein
MPSMQTGTAQVAVNETAPLGVLFVTRPPSLCAEPPREEHDESKDDTKMKDVCERIRRVRREDLSSEGLAFWEALGQLHHDGRRAASATRLGAERGAVRPRTSHPRTHAPSGCARVKTRTS